MRECACGRFFADLEHARCMRCRRAGSRARVPSPWTQEPEGCVTIHPILERYGLHGSASVFGCEVRTLQRMARRTFTIPQARAMADLFGVRVKELWPELAEIDQQLGAVEWRERAACKGKDVEMFFPPSGRVATARYAQCRAICNGCPVRDDCLSEALFIEERRGEVPQGFVGGCTPGERKALLGFRQDAARARLGATG